MRKMANKKTGFPGKHPFGVCLTHDVDRVRKTYQHITHFLKSGNPYHLASIIKDENPYWNFPEIMRLEDELGVKSTFFFLNEKRRFTLKPGEFKLYYGRYGITEDKVRKAIKKLGEGGWEIGLHGSYQSYTTPGLLAREKKELEEVVGHPINGVRQHYLNLDIPRTWRLQEEAGFTYDCTYGHRRDTGFRDKKYTPYRPYNPQTKKYMKILEIPTTIMDTNLMKGNTPAQALEKAGKIMEEAEKNQALINIIWHQRTFNKKEFPGYTETYRKIIEKAQQKKAWIGTTGQAAEIFR